MLHFTTWGSGAGCCMHRHRHLHTALACLRHQSRRLGAAADRSIRFLSAPARLARYSAPAPPTAGPRARRPRLLSALLGIGVAAGCAAPSPQAEATSSPPPTTSALGPSGQALPPGHPPLGQGTPAGPSVTGTVAVSPTVQGRVPAEPVLFLVARSEGRIVAVRREEGVRFPYRFELSGADAMTPGVPFEGSLEITARLSRSGDAIPAAGDVEGVARNVAAGARDVEIVLDTVRN